MKAQVKHTRALPQRRVLRQCVTVVQHHLRARDCTKFSAEAVMKLMQTKSVHGRECSAIHFWMRGKSRQRLGLPQSKTCRANAACGGSDRLCVQKRRDKRRSWLCAKHFRFGDLLQLARTGLKGYNPLSGLGLAVSPSAFAAPRSPPAGLND